MYAKILALSLLAAAFLPAAYADPFRIQDMKEELEQAGVKEIRQAILFGQPTISGQMNQFGFNAALRGCSRIGEDEDLFCTEAAFKACAKVTFEHSRQELLELANTYNGSRRMGYLVLANKPGMGNLLCVEMVSHFEDENLFSYDEVGYWELAIEDLRSFIAEEGIDLVNPSQS